ncbi:hypothetical protein M407DRAFT_148581 [Tulasnella calospora MUT 4182]|uniref:F-box domain-containing protein n=1 Tax=Tulasnella calospora MUT 4182 TaxID=1051891 RepID=A0A0C3KD21_9AGAM|nr:hypothetical protein M407DRAFT_148581 [Tulasnella calospora MUT 4182]
MTQLPASKLLGLPFELHECISIFLPPGSIASLIKANCQLRLIHEKTLYHHINLYGKPDRSVGLLRTFAFRPDLALLVHSLEITFSWINFTMSGGSRVILPSHLSHLNALALARNIKSFGLRGADWSSHQKMASIREIISKMELKSLQIFASVSSYGEPQEWILANLRLMLQGQPTLRDLTFKFPGCRGDVPNELESSDIPSLRTLRAQALTLVSISPVAIGDRSSRWRSSTGGRSGTNSWSLPFPGYPKSDKKFANYSYSWNGTGAGVGALILDKCWRCFRILIRLESRVNIS